MNTTSRSRARLAICLLLVAIAAVAMAGCGAFVPKESKSVLTQERQESNAASTTTDVVEKTVSNPAPANFKVTDKAGNVMEFDIPASQVTERAVKTTADEKLNSEEKGNLEDSESIPLFVKLIGAGIGLIVLTIGVMFAINWFKKTVIGGSVTRGANAAWGEASTMVGNYIHGLRTMQTTTTDANVLAALKAAEAEAQRLASEINKD